MLAGQGVDALYASLEHLDLLSVGLNCATGPEFMTDHLRTLSGHRDVLRDRLPERRPAGRARPLRGDGGEPGAQDAPLRRRGLGQPGGRLLRDDTGAHSRARPSRGRPAATPASRLPRPRRERHRGAVPRRRQPAGDRGRAHQRHRLAQVQGADRRGEVRGGGRGRPRPGAQRGPGARRLPRQPGPRRDGRHGALHDLHHQQGQGARS